MGRFCRAEGRGLLFASLCLAMIQTLLGHEEHISDDHSHGFPPGRIPVDPETGEVLQHKCIHNELIKGFVMHQEDTLGRKGGFKRSLQVVYPLVMSEKLLRIKMDYSASDVFIQGQTSLSSLYQMSKRVMGNTVSYFQTFLKVNTNQTITIAARNCAQNVPISQVTAEELDVYVKVNAENNNQASYFAAAQTCVIDDSTKRPIAGIYFLNFASMKGSRLYEYFYFTTFVHEFMHILFFSSNHFDNFLNPATNAPWSPSKSVNSGDIFYANGTKKTNFNELRFPNLVEFAKKYFGCNTLTGLPLEDGGGQGTAGSHWEKLIFSEDVMNPTIEYPAKISPFTVEVIKASGWYTVVGDMSTNYNWGYKSGCVWSSFTQNTPNVCPTTFEYCPAGSSFTANVCSPDSTAKAACSAPSLGEYYGSCMVKRKLETSCLLNLPNDIMMGQEEYYGPHARCIPWQKKTDPATTSGECHAIRCVGGKVQFRLKSGIIRTCNFEGEKVDFPGEWRVNCPDPSLLCTNFANRCPMDCSAPNGMCLNGGKCFCFTGYSGVDCSVCEGCTPIKDDFILSSNISGKFVLVDPLNFTANTSNLTQTLLLLLVAAYSFIL